MIMFVLSPHHHLKTKKKNTVSHEIRKHPRTTRHQKAGAKGETPPPIHNQEGNILNMTMDLGKIWVTKP